MRKSTDNSDTTQGSIVRIQQKKDGHFDVYFKFLPIPVEMNQDYLNAVIKDLNIDHLNPLIA